MKELSRGEIINMIRKKEKINALLKGGFVEIKITNYAPVIGLAMHAGERITREYADLLKFNPGEAELQVETYTDFYISGLPIQIIVRDNKAIYDLEMPKVEALRTENYKGSLKEYQKKKLMSYYDDFYAILNELISMLAVWEKKIYLYDIHSEKSEKLIKIKVKDKNSLVTATDLVKLFDEVDKKLVEDNVEILETTDEFVNKLTAKHKKLNHIRIYVDEPYKGHSRNDYYIPVINRIRRVISLSIVNLHSGLIKAKEVINEGY